MGPGDPWRAEGGEDQWDVGVSQEEQRLTNGQKREPGGVPHRPAVPPYCPWLQLAAGAPLCFPEPFLCGVAPGTATDSSLLPVQAALPEEDDGSGADLLSELCGCSEGRTPGNRKKQWKIIWEATCSHHCEMSLYSRVTFAFHPRLKTMC